MQQGWTEQRDQALIDGYRAGRSYSVLAGLLETTRSAISGRLCRLGLQSARKPAMSAEEREAKRRAKLKRDNENRRNRGRGIYIGPRPVAVVKARPAKPVNDLREVALHLSFVDLDLSKQCHFPYSDGPYTFCGHPIHSGSYCQPHAIYCTEVPA